MRCRAVQRQAPLRLFSRPGFRWRPPGGCSVRVLSPSGEEGCEPAGLAGAFPILLSPSQSEDLHLSWLPGSEGGRLCAPRWLCCSPGGARCTQPVSRGIRRTRIIVFVQRKPGPPLFSSPQLHIQGPVAPTGLGVGGWTRCVPREQQDEVPVLRLTRCFP